MKKVLFVLPALAVMCLATSVHAENGSIDSDTLSAMGLSGVQEMSDSEATDVRGMGYQPLSSVLASGKSYASISSGPARPGTITYKAGSQDRFRSLGTYLAGGEHVSDALLVRTVERTTSVPGVGSLTRTRTFSLGIGAGGSASGYAF